MLGEMENHPRLAHTRISFRWTMGNSPHLEKPKPGSNMFGQERIPRSLMLIPAQGAALDVSVERRGGPKLRAKGTRSLLGKIGFRFPGSMSLGDCEHSCGH